MTATIYKYINTHIKHKTLEIESWHFVFRSFFVLFLSRCVAVLYAVHPRSDALVFTSGFLTPHEKLHLFLLCFFLSLSRLELKETEKTRQIPVFCSYRLRLTHKAAFWCSFAERYLQTAAAYPSYTRPPAHRAKQQQQRAPGSACKHDGGRTETKRERGERRQRGWSCCSQ